MRESLKLNFRKLTVTSQRLKAAGSRDHGNSELHRGPADWNWASRLTDRTSPVIRRFRQGGFGVVARQGSLRPGCARESGEPCDISILGRHSDWRVWFCGSGPVILFRALI